jgi:FAD:protein FMN transferase
MACQFEIVLPGESAGHVPAARAALDEADRVEAKLTVFRDTSDVVRVNATASAAAVQVDRLLFQLLARCADLHRETGGAFDVTSTALSRCWGFLRREGRLPTAAEIESARDRVGMDRVELDGLRRSIRFTTPGVELNFGAIGKGFALDRMATRLRRRGVGDALLSAGGSSILAVGDDHGGGWPIDVRPRLLDGRRIARLRVGDVAIATSGAGEQHVVADGRRYGHVLDPRTGWPAEGVLSATVVTGDAASADALSTAMLIAGSVLAERCASARANTMVLLTLESAPEDTMVFGRCNGAAIEEA